MGKLTIKFIILLLLAFTLSCSGGSSTQSVEDVGDDTSGDNSGGDSGGIIPEPVASFAISSSGGESPYNVTFTSTSTGEISSYLWNVDDDDDIESTYSSFTHVYEDAGTYGISLTVTGPGGQSIKTETDAITITDPDTSTESGLFSETMSYDSETREYLIYIPSSYDMNEATPIVFAFHGFGGNNQYFINTADFRSLADQYNFIVVYPQALVCNGGTTWNTAPPGGDNKCSQDDIGFFGAFLYEISGNYNVDSEKVYLTGYSNGAGFSYAMACYQSSLVTAVAPVSGLMPMNDSSECSPSHPTSVILFNGTNDDSRPYDGIEGYMMSVDETVTYWSGYNNTDSNPNVTTVGNIENSSYQNGDSNSAVDLFKINGGGHDWFSLDFNGSDIEELIWYFLSQHTSD